MKTKIDTSKVERISSAIMKEKNWTGHSLSELVSFGRCVPAVAKQWAVDSMNHDMENSGLELSTEEWLAVQDSVEEKAEKIWKESN